jgi:DtxR family manganese transport transcriptional regulator
MKILITEKKAMTFQEAQAACLQKKQCKIRKSSPNRAESFIATRQHHLLETAEDYVELVADLIQSKGEARTCDIAACLGVTHVAVVRTLYRLQRKGYLCAQPHKPITLTESGKQLAAFSKSRHKFLLEYLISIGVPEDIAAIDAEGMEHHISVQTLEAFRKQLALLKQ